MLLSATGRASACLALAGSTGHQQALVAPRGLRQARLGLRHRCRPSDHSRRQRVQTTAEAVLHGRDTVALPLDYYKMLSVSGVCSRDSLARALEKSLTSPPSVGYSQQCLLARGSTLKRAVETLLDPQGRRVYDDALLAGKITEEVPEEFVPGVLALLLEAGDPQTVVAAGEEWLSTHRRDSRVRDVALSTALAHREVALTCVKKYGDAVSAAGMLRVAGELLRRHRAAPGLQQQVAEALAELQPALACQLVALPLEQFQERERGLQVAISVMTDSSGAKRGMGKQQFLDRLSEQLTAEEQITAYEAAGSRYAELPSELYDVALAYIASAASSGRAAQLDKALAALAAAAAAVPPGALGQASDSGVRQLAERRAIDEQHRRQVAYAVCQLLLGDTAAAADTLGLSAGSPVKCERSMLAFVKANCPDPSDPLPGLCVLAQRWVADVALGSFRGTQGATFSLEGWFELGPVRRYVSRRDPSVDVSHPLLASAQRAAAVAAAPLIGGLAGVLSWLGLLAGSQNEEQQEHDEGLYGEKGEEAEEEQLGMDGPVAAASSAAAGPSAAPAQAAEPLFDQFSATSALPAAPARQAAAPAPRMPPGRSSAEVAGAAAAHDMSQVDMRASRSSRQAARPPPSAAPAAAAPGPPSPRELQPRHTARPDLTARSASIPAPAGPVEVPPQAAEGDEAAREFDANVAFAMQPVEQLTPLTGEERMWDTVEQRTVRWGRLAATAALLAGGIVLLARSLLMPGQPPAAVAGMQASPAPVAVAVPAPAASAPVLSRTQAATVVAQWQAVKARALGPEHDTSGLRGILRGEVLVQWQDRARQIQSKGWHYLHSMEASQINSVKQSADGSAALVSATFREAVEAHRGPNEPVQAFRSEYSVDYELVPEGDTWVITGAVVRY
ncbi:hypothetical protein D9Q98_006500 [Chlorella vulgaris]|uniref:ARC6 IMS domain-containing protein n=1 Tax=Chlorella vulgaris TaxID=3077 RepID=A0A9D4TKB7_CHLVU|nr:hypothetical protein D9Q98_006500 [Chlorella vulgaris]